MEKTVAPSACNHFLFCKDTKLSSIAIINIVKNSKNKEKNSIFAKKY
jgi:hypothetical protein